MPRRAKKPEERKKDILQACLALFLEQGFTATAVSDVVQTLGVSQGTFYYHFESKEAALDALVRETAASAARALSAIAEDPALAPWERLQEMLKEALRASVARNNLVGALLRPENALLYQQFVRHVLSAAAPVAASVIAEGCASGHFTVRRPLETASLIIASLEALLLAPAGQNDPGAFTRLWEAAGELLPRALGVAKPDRDADSVFSP